MPVHAFGGREISRRDFLQRSGTVGLSAWASFGADCAALQEPKSPPAAQGDEYAAGPITLPFSYSIEHSPAARPKCLEFVHQVSPDNCQVFIRIDGELWEFRSQWVINLGTTARWKGPNVDPMVRVEHCTYPDGMTSCWFLGGMWYDEPERKWARALRAA